MKNKKYIIYSLLSILFLVGCNNEKISNNNSLSNNLENEKTNTKIYQSGEKAFIEYNGQKMYSLTINKIVESNDFQFKNDFTNVSQIIEIDYTYENLNSNNDIDVHSGYFTILDNKGFTTQSSSMFPKKMPQSIPIGGKCNVQGYHGVENKSDLFIIDFEDIYFGKKIKFEIPLSSDDNKNLSEISSSSNNNKNLYQIFKNSVPKIDEVYKKYNFKEIKRTVPEEDIPKIENEYYNGYSGFGYHLKEENEEYQSGLFLIDNYNKEDEHIVVLLSIDKNKQVLIEDILDVLVSENIDCSTIYDEIDTISSTISSKKINKKHKNIEYEINKIGNLIHLTIKIYKDNI